jgi:hypothetical protein
VRHVLAAVCRRHKTRQAGTAPSSIRSCSVRKQQVPGGRSTSFTSSVPPFTPTADGSHATSGSPSPARHGDSIKYEDKNYSFVVDSNTGILGSGQVNMLTNLFRTDCNNGHGTLINNGTVHGQFTETAYGGRWTYL